jgi:excisionase family DNA binding protein
MTEARYLDVAGVSTYISKTEKAVRHMVASSQIPFARIGRSLRFDRELIDRWMARHLNRGKPQ